MKKKILKDFYRKDQQVALKSKSGTYDPIVLDKKMTNILRNCLRFKKRKEKKKNHNNLSPFNHANDIKRTPPSLEISKLSSVDWANHNHRSLLF